MLEFALFDCCLSNAIFTYFIVVFKYDILHYEPMLKTYNRLSLSRIPRDSLKYFEIFVPRHIRFAEYKDIRGSTLLGEFI